MLAKTLRDDQALAIYHIRDAVASGQTRIVVQGPTGMGKGLLIADIVDRALIKGKRILITVPAISLVDQTLEVLAAEGIRDTGVIQAQHPATDWSRPVQVCSVQTLTKRWTDGKMPKADVVLVDEVHRWFTLFPKWICDVAWQGVPFIGFSATPWTKGLGALYQRLIIANTIDKLIGSVLVPFRTFVPDVPDLSGVSVVAGDFVTAELEEVMRPKKLTANIVETWLALAKDRPTVCFCCSRAHADQVAKEFESRGVGAAYMDCETSRSHRAEVRRRKLEGKVQVVCNVEIVGIGVDWPEVSCIIYARPTMSDMRFVQNVGRGLRSCKGKTDLLILDHSTTTMRLGMVDEVYALHRELDDGKTKVTQPVAMLLPKPCEACNYLKPPRTATCPNCGHKQEAHVKQVAVARGTLREIKPGEDMNYLRKLLPDRQSVFGQLVWYGKKKGYSKWWPNMKFNDLYGVRFPQFDYEEQPPGPDLLNWIIDSTKKWKGQQDYAKSKVKKAALRSVLVPGTLMTEQDVEDFK